MSERARRIALFVPNLDGGGAERVMLMIANGLADRNHDVDLLVCDGDGPFRALVSPRVRVVNFRRSRVLNCVPDLRRYLSRCQPSALLSALNHANLAAISARFATHGRTKLVVSVHNSVRASHDRTARSSLLRVGMRYLYQRADAVVTVSDGIRQEIIDDLGLQPRMVHTIYNPLDTQGILTQADEPAGHEWLDAPSVPVVMGIGRLAFQKNFPLLIDAFALARKVMPLRLVILGEGPDRAAIEEKISSLGLDDSVHLAGFQENPYAWLGRSDVFVLSSRFEGLPVVLLEALACGVPVVSTDCRTGPSEILEDGRWGCLVPMGEPESMSRAILDVLSVKGHPRGQDRAADFEVLPAVLRYERLLMGGDSAL